MAGRDTGGEWEGPREEEATGEEIDQEHVARRNSKEQYLDCVAFIWAG